MDDADELVRAYANGLLAAAWARARHGILAQNISTGALDFALARIGAVGPGLHEQLLT